MEPKMDAREQHAGSPLKQTVRVLAEALVLGLFSVPSVSLR
jgi:hypothetical protein